MDGVHFRKGLFMSASVNICARRKYMRPFMRPRIKACIESAPSVVKGYSCGFASIRDSKDS